MKEESKRWTAIPAHKTLDFWLWFIPFVIFLIPYPGVTILMNLITAGLFLLLIAIQSVYCVYTSDNALTLFIGFTEKRVEWRNIKDINQVKDRLMINTKNSKRVNLDLKRLVEKEAFINLIQEKIEKTNK
jgi:hypothetical protein